MIYELDQRKSPLCFSKNVTQNAFTVCLEAGV